ncbi:MAG: 2-C-methyl-D-erythritol 2,4-cyclodiphosphate synthase [Victivallales bacterium]|nr:2-C-methyl-D-erythritol 2,4-cyclodiphosphate synthase [Victivallales bacterium]
MFRVGHGYDVHRLQPGKKLILGGVEIPHSCGLDGHSDADVAVHALTDAVLGALALGDIGQWFPPSDAAYKNADSLKLLATILRDEKCAAYGLGNCDITIVAQKPRLAPYIQRMRENLAAVFGCETSRISVKATTTEELGFCGRGEGIAVYAVVLMRAK